MWLAAIGAGTVLLRGSFPGQNKQHDGEDCRAENETPDEVARQGIVASNVERFAYGADDRNDCERNYHRESSATSPRCHCSEHEQRSTTNAGDDEEQNPAVCRAAREIPDSAAARRPVDAEANREHNQHY